MVLSSGINEIILNNLNSLSNLKTRTDSVAFAGIREPITITRSKTFQPSEKKSFKFFSAKNLIIISTKKDQGITQLIDIIGKFVERGCRTEGSFITRSRHRDALEKTKNHLSIIVKNDLFDVEVIVEELRSAVNSLARITGHIDVEDLLDVIFKDFCIGK